MDVIIMGGGLVGASLAACLARDPGVQITVVEKFAPPAADTDVHPSYDARNTALANGTCHIFQQLGLWPAMRAQAEPIQQIEITDQGGFGRALIRAQEERVRALGYVIENRFIGQHLFAHLRQCPNVDYLAPAAIESLSYQGECMQVGLQADGRRRTLTTPLLVIADGAQSRGRELLGIESRVTPYDQVALVTAVTPDRPHHNLALERFTASGPLAVLPQTDNRWGITWCLAPARAEALMAADDRDFMAALEQAAGPAVGRLTRVGKRVTYPLVLTLAREQVRPNAVVLGNAAHGLHPVAGQGFNMAMRDVAVLVQTLFGAAEGKASWGQLSLLQSYLQRRGTDQLNTIQFSDKLTRLFSNRNPLLGLARNSGLLLFDTLQGTKRFVARHAMGRAVSTRLPEALSVPGAPGASGAPSAYEAPSSAENLSS
ncbi:MAG: 2-octaprenyl-6-methoxyphenyl hydroxylase [Pseudomonadota bacterium]|nr:2-octaprenyl-6-methoxyphenyl hydroxylase [Pseudomonadota bacterium]